jgi:hypothetical protein
MDARHPADDEGNPPSTVAELRIEGELIALSARYSLRFLEHADRAATPVLYYDGRRVIRGWSLHVEHDQPADRWGISGGRD